MFSYACLEEGDTVCCLADKKKLPVNLGAHSLEDFQP